MRRLLLVAGLPLFLGLAASVTWVALDLPPPRLVLRHGFPPAGGPTGRKVEIEGVTFVEIGTGYFAMGSRLNLPEVNARDRICRALHLPWGSPPPVGTLETPVHWVEIRRPYLLAETEITNAQYQRFDADHARDWPDDDDPVTSVTWEEAQAYCGWLSARGGLRVRLPSEAEWENACRAGSAAEYCHGDHAAGLGDYAWYDANSGDRAHPVKTRRPNAWGFFDLHGNAWEWCEDLCHDDYEGAPDDGSAWTEGALTIRVFRGGACRLPARHCRSAFRSWSTPGVRSALFGFRPAASTR